MENYHSGKTIQELITHARFRQRRGSPVFQDLYAVREELRERRKQLLGSYISLERLIRNGASLDENAIEVLSEYLASRTLSLLPKGTFILDDLCYRFYRLAIYAIGSGDVGNETVDDIIQLAECLVRSQDIFITVTRNLLPPDMIGELFDFVESNDTTIFTSNFEDAVTGAIAVFLGALEDPVALSAQSGEEEGKD